MRYHILLLCMLIAISSSLFAGAKHVTVAGAGSHNGTSVGNAWTLGEANSSLAAGDTAYMHAGTYTTAINPSNSGSAGSPIVYLQYQADVCSLYTTGPVIAIVGKNYVIVQGIAVQMAFSNSWVVNVSGGVHDAILNCRIYGGALQNAWYNGDWPSVRLNQVSYCRLIGNYIDRQDNAVITTSDPFRGDGVNLYGSASDTKYNIIEGNTVINVSHYSICAPYDVEGGDSYNIVRFNTTYNDHVGIGGIDRNARALFEGNRSYSPSQMLSYRWGVSFEGTSQNGIFRFNEFYDDSAASGSNGTGLYLANATMTQGPISLDIDNRYYNNVFMGASRNATEWHSFAAVSDNGMSAYDQGRSVFVNNIFGPSVEGYGSVPYYWKDADNAGVKRDTLRNNIFWTGHVADTVAKYVHGSTYSYTLAAAKAAEVTFESTNKEASPLWVDSLSVRGNRSFQTSASSPCVDAGTYLTKVASGASSTTIVTVGDAGYFHYDWGASPYDRGDSVYFSNGVRGELDSVDYTNRHLILKASVTVPAGSGVYVLATWSTETSSYTNRLSGSAPDIGPYERGSSGGGGGGVTLPGSTALISPDSNSTQMQPVTFKWRAVSGATKYWFSLSPDNWSSLYVNNYALTDTFITVSGMALGTWYVWNVATGNDAGWNYDAWSTWWTVEAGSYAPTGDTLTLNWNDAITDSVLTASTLIQNVNVGRLQHTLVLRNPGGYSVNWSGITWPQQLTAPQPTPGDTSLYMLIRSGVKVYGFDLTKMASAVSSSAHLAHDNNRTKQIFQFGINSDVDGTYALASGIQTTASLGSPMSRAGSVTRMSVTSSTGSTSLVSGSYGTYHFTAGDRFTAYMDASAAKTVKLYKNGSYFTGVYVELTGTKWLVTVEVEYDE